MSYQVIARKYRPQRFSEVVGQEHVTQTLSNAIQQGRIAHAYIFCGPRGTGKTTIARIFAKCLNCEDGPKVDFADDDPRCVEITEGRAMDVIEIDGASNRGIEEVRELRETVKYAPATARFKVVIIDEVHMLTKEAFNALLKTLEEPPAHVKFMFATTDPEKVLPTILSRCQRFDLRRIPAALIIQHLGRIAGQEGVEIEEAALQAIARGADGCMRDAQSTLDQLISFCGEKIVEADVLSMFGLTARSQVNALAKSVLTGDQPGILRELTSLARNGKDLGRLLGDLLEHFRNLLVYRVSRGKADWLETSEAENEVLREQAGLADTAALTRIMEILAEGEGRLRAAISRQILLEVTLLRASEAREMVSLDAVLKQLNALRAEASAEPEAPAAPSAPAPQAPRRAASPAASPPPAAAPEPPAPEPAPVLREQPTPAAPPRPEGPTLAGAELDALWQEVVAALKKSRAFSRRYLEAAFPVSLEKGVLTLGFDEQNAEYLPLVDNAKARELVIKLLAEQNCPNCQVRFVQARRPTAAPKKAKVARPKTAAPEADAAPDAPTETAPEPDAPESPLKNFDPATFKDDPQIKQALEIFKARIVQVIPPSDAQPE